ncbi:MULTISPECIES: MBL fold metallo-hydrolase [unclassified Rhizobacter]|uniref:MBL fold metallo-hydrolase n=1 Tax=unclassified Rhizobacter TaxID=2640088 RepID=UPI0006FFA481|nr:MULTISPECIES: MBL fold metallo-hydrolase [unclassified Rhizobacter]KQU81471.1 MBL fold metallo-hydrolase [Rhizobacter sp. Root29]KQW12199.1 MBL fold metallo-hydrolase [Rhizobacter sp. Root1238]KRB03014.1 MBL fold metallo-hydrolase [Rhizobacter sp. Root16D2]
MVDTLPFVQRLAHDIHVIDTGFHRPAFDACYLVVENGRGAFIDTGTTHSLPRLLAAVDAAGLQRADVDWVIVTHVHLDHAGGAGALMRELPAAKLLAHPRGARHMVEPLALLNGARAVYGAQEVTRAYGEVVPVPAERVVNSHDGMVIELAGRPLLLIDTPGHARHHHCIWDERSRGFFTGDTFGLSYREFDTAQGPWLLPTTTPVQFEPDALKQSVRRMLDFRPERLYLTHYGCVENVPRLGEMMLAQVDEIVALGERMRPLPAPARHAALMAGLSDLYWARLQQFGSPVPRDDAMALLAMDLELNAQGIGIWLDR